MRHSCPVLPGVPQLWSNWDGRLVQSAVMHTAANVVVPQCCLSDQCGENMKGMLQQQRMQGRLGPLTVATSRLRRLSWSLTAMALPNWCDSNSILTESMGSEPDFDAAPVRMSCRMHAGQQQHAGNAPSYLIVSC